MRNRFTTSASGRTLSMLCETVTPSFSNSRGTSVRSEEHTSELQSRLHLVCRLLLEKKNGRRQSDAPGHGAGNPTVPTIFVSERSSVSDNLHDLVTRQCCSYIVSGSYSVLRGYCSP